MAGSNKRKTKIQGYSLDPQVAEGIAALAKELGCSKSALVNYIMGRSLRAMTTPDIIPREQAYKLRAAGNKTMMYPGAGLQKWSIVLDLEFEEGE